MKNFITVLCTLFIGSNFVFGEAFSKPIDTLYFYNNKVVKYINFENSLINIKDLNIEIPNESGSFLSLDSDSKPQKANNNLKTVIPSSVLSKLLEEQFFSKYAMQYSYRVENNYLDSNIQGLTIFFHTNYEVDYLQNDFVLLFIFKDSILKSITEIYSNVSGLGSGRELKVKHVKKRIFLLHDILKFSDSSGDKPQITYCKFDISDVGIIKVLNNE